MSSETSLNYISFRYEGDNISPREDLLLIERPLSLRINHEPWTLTMQTPGHEIELAAGLAFTEGVIKRPYIVSDHFVKTKSSETDTVDITVPEEKIHRHEMRKRTMLSLSSCGICGRTELPDITGNADIHEDFRPSMIPHLLLEMQNLQTLFTKTGGCHAAAAFDITGELLCCMEDIGRHNAVDKVIGHLILNGKLDAAKVMTVSSRVSYEIIVKCYAAAIPVIVAVSAPSSLAVDMAKEFSMSLYAFCRENRCTRYA